MRAIPLVWMTLLGLTTKSRSQIAGKDTRKGDNNIWVRLVKHRKAPEFKDYGLTAAFWIAYTLKQIGRLEDAIAWQKVICNFAGRHREIKINDVLTYKENYALSLREICQDPLKVKTYLQAAIDASNDVLTLQERNRGKTDEETIKTLAFLARLEKKVGRHDMAIANQKEVADRWQKAGETKKNFEARVCLIRFLLTASRKEEAKAEMDRALSEMLGRENFEEYGMYILEIRALKAAMARKPERQPA